MTIRRYTVTFEDGDVRETISVSAASRSAARWALAKLVIDAWDLTGARAGHALACTRAVRDFTFPTSETDPEATP